MLLGTRSQQLQTKPDFSDIDPFPGTFTLNRQAVVTARFFEQAYQERHTVASVLVRLGGALDLTATKTSAAHIEMTSYVTDPVAAPGTRFAIVLDVTPGPRIHVYAPGVKGYRPMDEHVLVYHRPFRIIQDVMIDPSRAAAPTLKDLSRMTIRATLEYQACDDKLCFLPQSVPLSWMVELRPLDTDRGKVPR